MPGRRTSLGIKPQRAKRRLRLAETRLGGDPLDLSPFSVEVATRRICCQARKEMEKRRPLMGESSVRCRVSPYVKRQPVLSRCFDAGVGESRTFCVVVSSSNGAAGLGDRPSLVPSVVQRAALAAKIEVKNGQIGCLSACFVVVVYVGRFGVANAMMQLSGLGGMTLAVLADWFRRTAAARLPASVNQSRSRRRPGGLDPGGRPIYPAGLADCSAGLPVRLRSASFQARTALRG